jgi:hypothetical protein
VDSVYNDYVIHHTCIARVYVINKDASAGLDRGLDDFARLVYDVTGAVENITARIIRAVLANNERFHGLITAAAPSSVVAVMIAPVTVTVSVAVCLLCVEFVCANARGAISAQQARVTIVFFVYDVSLLMFMNGR